MQLIRANLARISRSPADPSSFWVNEKSKLSMEIERWLKNIDEKHFICSFLLIWHNILDEILHT